MSKGCKVTIAVIHWTDSAIHGSQQISAQAARDLRPVRGVAAGLLVSETKDSITLALDSFEDSDYRCVNTYYKPQIRRILRRKI